MIYIVDLETDRDMVHAPGIRHMIIQNPNLPKELWPEITRAAVQTCYWGGAGQVKGSTRLNPVLCKLGWDFGRPRLPQGYPVGIPKTPSLGSTRARFNYYS